MEGLPGFLLASIALAGSPGPATLSLAAAGAAPVVTVAAALYFVWLAWRIATAAPLTEEAGQRRPPSLAGGLALSLVNPKGYAAMAALFSGFVLLRDRLAFDVGLKIALLTVLITAVNIVWLMSGALLTRFFREPRSNRITNVVFALLLLASVPLAIAW
jgi:threonine/homoserine/homoserine lactone efflux protein